VLALTAASVLAPMAGAAVGAAVLAGAFAVPFRPAWAVWWGSNLVGILVVGPLALSAPPLRWRAWRRAVAAGGLSVGSGRLAVRWQVGSKGLALDWIETVGPSVVPPAPTGFGTRVIHGSIESQLGGTVASTGGQRASPAA
jgi:hypothetical protein